MCVFECWVGCTQINNTPDAADLTSPNLRVCLDQEQIISNQYIWTAAATGTAIGWATGCVLACTARGMAYACAGWVVGT